MSCPLPVLHPFLSSPHSSSCCVSQISQERTKGKAKYRTKKISKDHIGSPNNFRHLYHIGWSPTTGFTTNLASELNIIFAQAGVTQDHLKDKRTSKKIFEMIEKQGGIKAVLNEAKIKGVLMGSSAPSLPSELGSAHLLKNELKFQPLRTKNGLKQAPVGASFISEAQKLLQSKIPSVVISSMPSMSPVKRKPQHNMILNLKEVQLKKAQSDNQTLSGPGVLMCHIKKEAQLKTSKEVGCSHNQLDEEKCLQTLTYYSKHNRGKHTTSETGIDSHSWAQLELRWQAWSKQDHCNGLDPWLYKCVSNTCIFSWVPRCERKVALSPLSPQCSSDGGIIAALKDVIQKRHKSMHVSDEESDLEKGGEWDEDVTNPQEERQQTKHYLN